MRTKGSGPLLKDSIPSQPKEGLIAFQHRAAYEGKKTKQRNGLVPRELSGWADARAYFRGAGGTILGTTAAPKLTSQTRATLVLVCAFKSAKVLPACIR